MDRARVCKNQKSLMLEILSVFILMEIQKMQTVVERKWPRVYCCFHAADIQCLFGSGADVWVHREKMLNKHMTLSLDIHLPMKKEKRNVPSF